MEIYSVTEALYYLKTILEIDERLSDIWLRGEVSGCRRVNSGHFYFTLKDSGAAINCALFKNTASRQTHQPSDGGSFLVRGYFSIYEDRGSLQFYVSELKPDGAGRLALEFEALKARLEAEGLFVAERKRPLPERPKVIGLVTSPTGAALQDILNVLGRRHPLAQIVLAPTLVQGENAPPQIIAAIQALNRREDVEVIIVARGGGALEELWCFNDEKVARAVFASRVPVITGVGHEIDFTIVDFVADVRAPTPSAAAELVALDISELKEEVAALEDGLFSSMQNMIDQKRSYLAETQRRLKVNSPKGTIPTFRQRIDDLTNRATLHLNHRLKLDRAGVNALAGQLKVLDPRQILERGYAVITRPDGQVVSSVNQVPPGEKLDVRVSDGKFAVEKL